MAVFVSDIDNTLYSHVSGRVAPRVIKALEELTRSDITVVLATARILAGGKSFCEQIGLDQKAVYLITGNGSEIYRDGYLYQATIAPQQVAEILAYSQTVGLDIGVDQGERLLISRYNPAFDDDRRHLPVQLWVASDFLAAITQPVHKVSLSGDHRLVSRCYEQTVNTFSPQLAVSNAGADYIDIVAAGHDKAYGLQKLLELLGKTQEKVYYIGDSYNDIDLMKAADIAACVGNGVDQCQAICQIVTADCEQGGAADFIEMIINEQI